jgi:hypothetical protein
MPRAKAKHIRTYNDSENSSIIAVSGKISFVKQAE